MTSLGVALGTPTYMSPEQATASPQTDHRADIYALGVMTYEMLTGMPPFTGRSPRRCCRPTWWRSPPSVDLRRPAVPAMLGALVHQCLAKRPADRPQSAQELMHVLDALATPSGGTVPTTVGAPGIASLHRYDPAGHRAGPAESPAVAGGPARGRCGADRGSAFWCAARTSPRGPSALRRIPPSSPRETRRRWRPPRCRYGAGRRADSTHRHRDHRESP